MKPRFLLVLLLLSRAAPAGDLLERYRLTLDRVRTGGPPAYSDDLLLADVIPRHERRFTEYNGDTSGRWLGALAANGEMAALDRLLPKILALQQPAGFFGGVLPDGQVTDAHMARLWGNGRLLVGLLESHRARPDAATLAAARKLGDWLVSLAPLMNSRETERAFELGKLATGYICWLQMTEPLAELYRLTRDDRYRTLAAELAGRTARKPGQHSHGFLTAVRGIADLYQVTREPQYLQRAEGLWQEVVNEGEVFPHGAVAEAFAPDRKRDEGCSEADWLRLSLKLWRLTGRSDYLDQAERTLFNEFAVNQFPSGDYGHQVIVPAGEIAPPQARAWWCCTLHGLRAFADIRAAAFHSDSGGITYDLAVDASFEDAGMRVAAVSSLASDAMVSLRVEQAPSAARRLDARSPRWAAKIEYRLNGRPLDAAGLTRSWKSGDRLQVRYHLATRQEKYGGRVAILHGPWLLGVDQLSSPAFFDEPHQRNRLDLSTLEPVPASGPLRFGVPVARFRTRYFPGGYPMQPATVVLRPLAEHTGLARESAWTYLFTPAK